MKKTSAAFIVAAVVASFGGCKPSASRYRELASTVDPPLGKLRDIVVPIYADDASTPAAGARVVAACLAAEPELASLRNVDFYDHEVARKGRSEEARTIVNTLLEHRPTMCMPDNGDPSRVATCQAWCIERWRSLAAAVDLVRNEAVHDGVEITPLRPNKGK